MKSAQGDNLEKLKKIYYPEKYVPINQINSKRGVELSILIPVYNSGKVLARTLASVVNQKTRYKYEIIIVNDGSTDNSLEIINFFKNKNKNIKVIEQSNHGISYARNVLLSNASGRYISFVDSDDVISEYFIEKMINFAKSKNAKYVKCNYLKINDKTGEIIVKSAYNEKTNRKDIDKYLWGGIIEKKEYEKVSFPENYWFEDMIFSFFIVSKIRNIEICEEYLYDYYEYDSSASKIQGRKSDLKNLDQFYLIYNIVNYFIDNDMKFSTEQEEIILHELGTMLMIRTRKLKYKIRKLVFYNACDLIEKIKFNQYYSGLRTFKTKNFVAWNVAAICERMRQNRRRKK